MSEVVKLFTCLILVFCEEGRDVTKFFETLYATVVKNYWDTIKICVPSFLYVLQNNLLYLSASHLDAATYQVSECVTMQLQLIKMPKGYYCRTNIFYFQLQFSG